MFGRAAPGDREGDDDNERRAEQLEPMDIEKPTGFRA